MCSSISYRRRRSGLIQNHGNGQAVLTLACAVFSLGRDMMDARGIDINGRWEDDWPALDIEAHDVTIASRSLIVDDLAMAVDKLRRHTRRRAYITTLVGDGFFDCGLIAGAGREFTPGLDYIVVLNYLRQIGIFAQLTFTTHHEARIFPTLDEAVEGLSWMVHDITAEEKIRLREYLDGALVRENGMLRLPTRPVRWAVLWWDEEGPYGQET